MPPPIAHCQTDKLCSRSIPDEPEGTGPEMKQERHLLPSVNSQTPLLLFLVCLSYLGLAICLGAGFVASLSINYPSEQCYFVRARGSR
ncbi:hypothetical protein JAAARDRAFT_39154 [Jaapia argillacea MUCL 33604]|uniref:Uncharacterized protein n=1 Tax=Jaapia argillacea MUCL 33604 TaxID=933084 RepID=A0A067PF11_9AGAM|nr:hypothetical protein JAAARDRAFT_39154 [Jaapia argillacea MUCL 33604]